MAHIVFTLPASLPTDSPLHTLAGVVPLKYRPVPFLFRLFHQSSASLSSLGNSRISRGDYLGGGEGGFSRHMCLKSLAPRAPREL